MTVAKSFVDEDWTGLTHQEIQSRIISEYQEKQVESETAEFKQTIKETQKDTSTFLLSVLEAVIREQVLIRELHMATGAYIVDAIRDQCQKKGWIE